MNFDGAPAGLRRSVGELMELGIVECTYMALSILLLYETMTMEDHRGKVLKQKSFESVRNLQYPEKYMRVGSGSFKMFLQGLWGICETYMGQKRVFQKHKKNPI